MPWNATAVTVTRAPSDKRRVRVMVTYANDATPPETESRAHDVASADELTAVVAQQLALYNQADALLANPPIGPVTIPVPPPPPPPPPDPNAGLAPLTVEGLLGLLSPESRAKLAVNPSLDAIRRDVLAQDRASLTHWIAVLAAVPDPSDPASVGVITPQEAQSLATALTAQASPAAQ